MAVKYRLIERKNLSQGRRVNVGELGNFRFGVGSTGAPTTEELTTSLIKEPKVVFSPGKALRIAKKLTNFEKKELSEPQSGGSQDSESPDEI